MIRLPVLSKAKSRALILNQMHDPELQQKFGMAKDVSFRQFCKSST
jgi:hypothetical protein